MQSDVNNRLVINLRDTGHTMRLLFEGKGSQSRILIILHETGGMTQSELTERIGVKPGSASEVIAKLENAGLITRTPSKTDRRTAEIKLTEAGKAKAKEAADRRIRRHNDMFSCLSEQEKEELAALLEKLNADWEQRYRSEKEAHIAMKKHRNCGKNHRAHNACCDDFRKDMRG